MGKRLAEGLGQGAGQASKHFAFHTARQIGTRPPRGEEKLRNAAVSEVGHPAIMNKPERTSQENRRRKVYVRGLPPKKKCLQAGPGGGGGGLAHQEDRKPAVGGSAGGFRQ